jgi:lipid II:glycine glycyltransferase (peptidoglycan interpeptide bridge formation enzyme)
VEAYARGRGPAYGAKDLAPSGSDPDRKLFALEFREPLGLRSYTLAPCSLYATPRWKGALDPATLRSIVGRLKTFRVRKFGWRVAFEDGELAKGLSALGVESRPETTHVLHLGEGYERVFAACSASIRNQVRKSRARGVTVRQARDEESIRGYYQVHTELAEQKGTYEFVYPLALIFELAGLSFSRLLVAEYERRIVGGAFFFVDDRSVVYWHGATDRAYSHLFPARSVMDEAIRWACAENRRYLNLGASAGIASLERFKESWGARTEVNRVFGWRNPVWELITRLKRSLPRRRLPD